MTKFDIDKRVKSVVSNLFKYLNVVKKKVRTEKELLEEIKHICKYYSIPTGYERYILALYLLNYREDGDYNDLTKGNFVDPREKSGPRTANRGARPFTTAKMPFHGSNLKGYWTRDPHGVEFYVVTSYDWWPMFIFKNDNWYVNMESQGYSVSTRNQYSNSIPNFHETPTYYVRKSDMDALKYGHSHETIMKANRREIQSKISNVVSNKKERISFNSPNGDTPIYIKYKITSIETEGEKFIIDVDIYDVVKRDNHSEVPTPENYLKGELGNVTVDFIENGMKKIIYMTKLTKFFGKVYDGSNDFFDNLEIEFRFKHLKK